MALTDPHRTYWHRRRPTLFVSLHAPPVSVRHAYYRDAFETLHAAYPHIDDCSGRTLDLV